MYCPVTDTSFSMTQSWIPLLSQLPQKVTLSLLQITCESFEEHKPLWNSAHDIPVLWKRIICSYSLLPFFSLTVCKREDLSLIPEQFCFFGERYCQKPFRIPQNLHQWFLSALHAHYWLQQLKAGSTTSQKVSLPPVCHTHACFC